MSPEIRSKLLAVVALAVLAALAWGLYALAATLVAYLMTLNPNVAAAIIAGSFTVLVSTGSVVVGKHLEKRALVSKEHRDKKIPVYEGLISFLYRMVFGSKLGNTPTEDEVVKFLAEFTDKITVWGSDDVLKAFVTFRRQSVKNAEESSVDPMALMFLYEDLLLAVRRDLGHKNRGLKQGDVLALIINDIDKYTGGVGRPV